MANRVSHTLNVGSLGERLVALGLQAQAWDLLEERWFCSIGELDLIAIDPSSGEKVLAFIEVKTRSQKNWDADGLLAINLRKQRQMSRAASVYLASHPEYENLPCRFDVALVQVEDGTSPPVIHQNSDFPTLNFGRDRLKLHRYVCNAFEGLVE